MTDHSRLIKAILQRDRFATLTTPDFEEIAVKFGGDYLSLHRDDHVVILSEKQARDLILILRRWLQQTEIADG
jgi:hypothetical protein